MKVLNLQCHFKHDFEGWFGSEEDFQNQLSSEMIECPMCASRQITKMLSAPRLNFGAPEPSSKSDTSNNSAVADGANVGKQMVVPSTGMGVAPVNSNLPLEIANMDAAQLQAAWLKMVHHVMANTEDVGDAFASEARKIHYGESNERSIRGHATRDETEELIEEGIAVLPLLVPAAIKGTIQ